MKKLSISNILIALSLAIIIAIGILQIINNGLNTKYQIESFEVGSDMLELKVISTEIILNNTQTIMILLALTILNSILLTIKLLNVKK
jgi:hypothetical protein